MQDAKRSEWLFHSQAAQRRRRVFLKQPLLFLLVITGTGGGLGALLCSSGVTCYADEPVLKLRFRKPLEVACNSARLASWMASQTAPVASANLV